MTAETRNEGKLQLLFVDDEPDHLIPVLKLVKKRRHVLPGGRVRRRREGEN